MSEVFLLSSVWLLKFIAFGTNMGRRPCDWWEHCPSAALWLYRELAPARGGLYLFPSAEPPLPTLQCRSRSPTFPFADAVHYAASENRNLFRLQLTLKIVFKNPFLSKTGCLGGWVIEYRGLLLLTMLANYQKLVLFDSNTCVIAHTD